MKKTERNNPETKLPDRNNPLFKIAGNILLVFGMLYFLVTEFLAIIIFLASALIFLLVNFEWITTKLERFNIIKVNR